MKTSTIKIDPASLGGSFGEFYRLSQKSFLLRDLDISPRTFFLWKSNGLSPLPEATQESEKREWVRLDFYQYLWLRMVKSLRNLGYPFEHIKRAKEELFAPTKIELIKELDEAHPGHFANLLEFMGQGQVSKEVAAMMSELFKNPEVLKQALGQLPPARPAIEMMVMHACQRKNYEVGYAFYQDGTLSDIDWDYILNISETMPHITTEEALNELIRQPHIYLSVTGIIREFILEGESSKGDLHKALLSDDELNLIRNIRSKEYKTISIHYDKGKDSRIIKTEKEKKIKDAEVKRFIGEVIFAPNSKTTVTKTNNGDLIINVSKTTKLTK